MSYDTAKWITPKDIFSSGFVDNTPESKMLDKFSPNLRNARLNWQSIEIRPWHTLFATLTAGTNPKWIGTLQTSVPANDRLVIRHNQDTNKNLVTVQEDWTILAISTSTNITSNNRMTFTHIGDVIYCMNWVDNFWKLSGTTYSVPSTWIASFAPSFSVTFNWCHWASGWASNPNKVYKSVADNYEDFNSTWSDIFTFWENITWLSANAEALFYFTRNTISATSVSDIQDAWTAIAYVTRWVQVKGWAVNHSSIVNAWTNIYFVTPSNKICQLIRWANVDWFEVIELSHRKNQGIDNLMRSLDDDQTDSFWYFLESENLVKWFFKSRWANFNDVCVIYDIIKDSFLIDNNKYFYGWVVFKNNNYTISAIEPKVYQDEYGTDDEDSPISFRYETKNFDQWMPTRKKELWETMTYVFINRIAELTQEIYVDWWLVDTKTIDSDNLPISSGGIWTCSIWTCAVWEDWAEESDYNDMFYVDILRTKWNLQNKGKKIKFVYSCNSLWARARLENLEMKIELLSEQSTELTT